MERTSVVIIGSGFAGLCMAIQLKKAGIDSFTILERADDIGGTWRDNHYPGCACDVQSHLYSFSFEPNPSWTRMFAPQAEIRTYLAHCADKYDLRRHVRLGENVVNARYDESSGSWTVQTSSGKRYCAQVLVSGMGALSNRTYPRILGNERFEGKRFHSAVWDHDYELAGKRVAVIGTGASAIQFVPEIAAKVAELHVYQRTAPWIVPRPDRPISAAERRLFQRFPWTQRVMRSALYWMLETRVLGMVIHPKLMKMAERAALRHIRRQVVDPELRRKVTPDYTIGCKRILLSDEWYPAISLPNVALITAPIREIRAHSIVTTDGRERVIDAIIYGTGFDVQTVVPRGVVFGRRGQDIFEVWNGSPEAYKGTTVTGFPNLFMLSGPNTGLGHSSMIYMIESQVAYVMDAVKQMCDNGWSAVETKPEVQAAYNQGLQKKQGQTVWQSGCKSWYLNESGKNTAIWPDFTFRFRNQTASFDAHNYRIDTLATKSAAPGQPKSDLVKTPGRTETVLDVP